ncbi:DUF6913 domain-containing protein [Lutibacter flavus]|uniref:Uncharacterized protein n=1 Tax=Lutibacter flavus TaxID=691689 RepID=A0A238V8P8_9FLAO|nr:hypothetical protein [Lutibacter flavus]SNR30581.1 hypothetical protein SAMN04488111_0094 [Lutibacter flavus]
MIFTGIKRKSNQIFFNKRLPELLNNINEVSSKNLTNILVIADDISVKDGILANLIDVLKISESNIEFVIFQQKIPKENELSYVYSFKDFGWYGKVNSAALKNILTKKYDLLINYSKVDNLYNNLLILQCEAGFKVGFASLDNRLYDLLIDCKPTEISLFNKELKKYLEILNKI